MVYEKVKHILPEFQFIGRYESGEELRAGNINNTYHLIYRQDDGSVNHYTLQQINSYAFKQPGIVMRNIELVTTHLRKKMIENGVNPYRRMLQLVRTQDDKVMLETDGSFWRAYCYVDRATAHDRAVKPEYFFETGRGFGEFQRLLSDFPAEQLGDTIPNFHNTRHRFETFLTAVKEDKAGRVKDLKAEIDFVLAREEMMSAIVSRIEAGTLPLRVTHNDTKINNILIDDESEKAICVIDLDTVMSGSALYDYGDAIRFGANTTVEDDPDTSKISLDLDLFERFTRGFLSEAGDILTDEEIRLLPLGAMMMTCELVVRFLTDYIDGDLYFKVRYPEHNIVRTRAQMKLLTDIEAKYDQLNEIVAKIAAEFRK